MTGFPEGEKSTPLWVGVGVAYDDVIDQFDLENLGGITQRAGHADVSRTGGRVAAYTAYGITGVMPHPVLCRMLWVTGAEVARLDAA
jgi:hypothetical protein